MIYFSITIMLLGLIIPLYIIIKKRKIQKAINMILYFLIQMVLIFVFYLLNYSNISIYDMSFYIAGICIFFALSYIDIREKVVDTHLMIVLLLFATISCVRFDLKYIISHFTAAIIGYLIMLIIKKIKSEQIGMGDVYIVPIIGLSIGIGALFRTMFTGMFIMLIYSIIGMIVKRISLKSELPMLPFICAGWMLCII